MPLPYNSTIPLLGIYPREMKIHIYIHTNIHDNLILNSNVSFSSCLVKYKTKQEEDKQ